jgi:hypothetical protein
MSDIEWGCIISDAELEEACVAAEESQSTKKRSREEENDSDYFEGDECYDENDYDDCTLRHFAKKRIWQLDKRFKEEYEPRMCSSFQELENVLYANRNRIRSRWNHYPEDDVEAEWYSRDMEYKFDFLPIEEEHLYAIEYEQRYMHLVSMWWNRRTLELWPNPTLDFFQK